MRLLYIATFLTALIFSSKSAGAQNPMPNGSGTPSTPPVKEKTIDRFFFGGNLGLQVGTVTYINVAPLAGYKITPRYWAGVGINYIYTNYFGQGFHLVGGRIFQQYFVWRGIFLHAEYEFMDYPTGLSFPNGKFRRNIANGFFVGPGYQQNLGKRAFTNVMFLYNVIWDPNNTIYNTPFALRFTFGF
jgi:hypothetical protein